MSDQHTEKAVAFLNDRDAAIWSIPPEMLPDLIEADPGRAKPLIVSTERVAEIAAQLQQWEALERAVKFLMACQQAVLDWWASHVRGNGIKLSQDPEKASPADAKKIIGFDDSKISRWRQSLQTPQRYEEQLRQAARTKAGLDVADNHRAEGTGENEWFTPEQYIAAAREVLGTIDLDPASNPIAQRTVEAKRFFTKQDDGLLHEWHGRVWLNPPYAQPAIGHFVSKLVDEFVASRTTQAILLTHNYTDTTWFHTAESCASLICFTRGRIKFVDADGDVCAPTQGQAFFYFGHRGAETFRSVFSQFGFVR